MKIVKNRFIYIGISVVLILCGLCSMLVNKVQGRGAFSYDIQFTGGTSIEANIGAEFNNEDIIAIVTEVTGDNKPQVQKAGAEGYNVIIKTRSLDEATRNSLVEAISTKYNIDKSLAFSTQAVSATISNEMKNSAMLAVFISCLAMLAYVTFRFKDFKIGAGAILALVNDVLLVLGLYAILRIPLNNSFIAAILTVLGYSINASIIIFDRMRENRAKMGKNNYQELVDVSVNQTMTRSIFTSLTTFITIACLYIFGVESIRQFALPIGIGILCGTYSSIFLSANVWYILTTSKSK